MASGEITRLLHDMAAASVVADRRALYDKLVVLVYDELRRSARWALAREDAASVQPTSLVHDVYARLADYRMNYQNRQHFLRVAASAMRRRLIERARALEAIKRGERPAQDALEDDIAAVLPQDPDRLLDVNRALACLTPEQVEFVELRYFLGFSLEETAEIMGLKVETAKKRWRVIKALLARELAGWSDDQ